MSESHSLREIRCHQGEISIHKEAGQIKDLVKRFQSWLNFQLIDMMSVWIYLNWISGKWLSKYHWDFAGNSYITQLFVVSLHLRALATYPSAKVSEAPPTLLIFPVTLHHLRSYKMLLTLVNCSFTFFALHFGFRHYCAKFSVCYTILC